MIIRLIVIVGYADNVEKITDQSYKVFLLVHNLWINFHVFKKLIHNYFILFFIDSISRRRLSSFLAYFIFPWA